jgi:hypothetical protein
MNALHRPVADQRTKPARTPDPLPLIEHHAAHEVSLDLLDGTCVLGPHG